MMPIKPTSLTYRLLCLCACCCFYSLPTSYSSSDRQVGIEPSWCEWWWSQISPKWCHEGTVDSRNRSMEVKVWMISELRWNRGNNRPQDPYFGNYSTVNVVARCLGWSLKKKALINTPYSSFSQIHGKGFAGVSPKSERRPFLSASSLSGHRSSSRTGSRFHL